MSSVIEKQLWEAFDSFRSGDLDRAEKICAKILKKAPRHPSANHLLGVLRMQRGDPKSAQPLLRMAAKADPANLQALEDLGAAEWAAQDFARAGAAFKQAIQRGKRDAATFAWCGVSLARQGEHAEATTYFEEAVRKEPASPDFRMNLANSLREQGRLDEAVEHYQAALSLAPAHTEVLSNLGATLQRLGRLQDAIQCYQKALQAEPAHVEARYNLGMAVQERREFQSAADCFQAVLQAVPGHVDARVELGIAFQGLGRFDEAISCFKQALEMQPGHADALNNLGVALYHQLDFAQAAVCLRKALAFEPDRAQFHFNLGNTLRALGDLEGAVASYRKALGLNPAYLEALNNLGVVLQEQDRIDEAVACFRNVLALKPDYADALLSLATAFLYTGQFDDGWKFYEARFDTDPPKAITRLLPSPRATEGDLGPGRRIAVWAEQGLGDQIMYSSLLRELLDCGPRLVFEVDRRVIATYRRSFPAVEFVAKGEPQAEALQRTDANVPVASLPGLLRRHAADFQRQPRGFLVADREKTAFYRGRLTALGEGLAVAVSWKSTHSSRGRLVQVRKSAPIEALAPLAIVEGVRLVDVQYGDTEAERAALAERTGREIIRFGDVDHFEDLEDVLAIIAACDLIITTCNVTAHFAGAMGKPTWLLYLEAKAPFFYWISGAQGRSLWYPSVEIVTARELRDWGSLYSYAAVRLEQHLRP